MHMAKGLGGWDVSMDVEDLMNAACFTGTDPFSGLWSSHHQNYIFTWSKERRTISPFII